METEWQDATGPGDTDFSLGGKIPDHEFMWYSGFYVGLLSALLYDPNRRVLRAVAPVTPWGKFDLLRFTCITAKLDREGVVYLAFRKRGSTERVEIALTVDTAQSLPSHWKYNLQGKPICRPFRHAEKLQTKEDT